MFRKNEKALIDWSPSLVSLCVARQQRIVHEMWDSLHEEGYLIYATCSFSPEENEDMLDYIAAHFEVESMSIPIPEAWGVVKTLSNKHAMAGYRFFPDKVMGEGFFIAVLQKKKGGQVAYFKNLPEKVTKKMQEQAAPFVDADQLSFIPNDTKHVIGISSLHAPDYALLNEHLYLRKAGVKIGMAGQKEWVPDHELALSLIRSDTLPVADFNREQALLFLKKENLEVALPKGWYIVTYQGLGLGWIKVLGNRVNNNLPKSWRIRMELPADN